MAEGDVRAGYITLTLTMSPALYASLVERARREGTSWMEECRKAIAAYTAPQKGKASR